VELASWKYSEQAHPDQPTAQASSTQFCNANSLLLQIENHNFRREKGHFTDARLLLDFSFV
jgi:hypothetical protein